MGKPTYQIKDWTKHFENNRTRELKELRFVILPNKHDGDGYTDLLDHPNGAAHYGAWVALVQVSSKGKHPAEGCDNPAGCCECRGTLLREGAVPHDPASLSRLTRVPADVFEEALPRLVRIGWLDSFESTTLPISEVTEIPHPPAVSSRGESRTPLRKSDAEWNGMEQNGKEEQPRAARADKRGSRLPEDFSLTSEMKEWAATNTPHVDLNLALAEFVDYWRGIPGQRGRKLDWDGTWRNRLRELEGRKNGGGRAANPTAETRPIWMASKK